MDLKEIVARMRYEQAKGIAEELVAKVDAASAAFGAFDSQFQKGPMGLTPDPVRAMPEWRALKASFDQANATWHKFARPYNQKFKKEIRADAMARREAKIRENQAKAAQQVQ